MPIDKNMQILVLDDHTTDTPILKSVLTQIGFTHVTKANDASHAIEILEKSDIDFVISDWHTAPFSGYDLLKSIRQAHNPYHKVPFLMVANKTKSEQVLQAKQAGVSNYILKPYKLVTLWNKIETIFDKAA